MKKLLKIISILLVFCLAVTLVLTGCKGNAGQGSGETTQKAATAAASGEQTQPADPKADLSEQVDLVGYIIGDIPRDAQMVEDEINKKLKADLNATIKWGWLAWSDYESKYSLVLASGEQVDFIYAGPWCGFYSEARKNAFMPLDELLPKYAPKLLERIPEEGWRQAKYNGKTYLIPQQSTYAGPPGLMYREDLREKYGTPEIKKLEDFEPYFAAIKKNEQGMIPFNASQQELSWLLLYSYMTQNGFDGVDASSSSVLPKGLVYGFEDEVPNLKILSETPEYTAYAKLVKSWADQGFWTTKVIGNKTASAEMFQQGKSSAFWMNGENVHIESKNYAANHPDWKLKFWWPVTPQGHVKPYPYVDSSIALSGNCENPERTLMVVEKLLTTQEYYDLMKYGIKGTHWIENADGSTGLPDGVTSENTGYSYNSNAIAWMIIKDLKRPEPEKANYKEYFDAFDQQLYSPKMIVFPLQIENIKSEVATTGDVISQYMDPVTLGFSKDVDKDIATLNEKLKTAGMQKILEETRKQVEAFFK